MPQIELVNITKSFGDKIVLKNINLQVEEGKLISLLGPSGCGKTTTLKIIAGLLTPDEGDVLFDGSSVLKVPVEKRGAVIVFQDYLLFPHLSVFENVEFGLKMAKVDKVKRKEKVRAMLRLVEMEGYEEKYPHELSGGQKQRVALARALAVEPKVLLLDEPFSNLDTRLRESMRDFILEIQKKLNITTILVTHDKEEALMMSDRIALMLNGTIKQYGSPIELYERPVDEEVANFFGRRNYIKGRIEKGRFISDIIAVDVENIEEEPVKAKIKPEDIELVVAEDAHQVLGIVKMRKYAGDRIYYTIEVKGMDMECISNRIFNVGDRVGINVDFTSAVFFKDDNEV